MDSLVIFCNNLNTVFAEASHVSLTMVAGSKILFTMIKMIEYLFSFGSTHFKKRLQFPSNFFYNVPGIDKERLMCAF